MMRWTKKKPTVPGYYWCRGRLARIPGIAFVVLLQKEWWVIPFPKHFTRAWRMSDKFWANRDWAGPIPEPK